MVDSNLMRKLFTSAKMRVLSALFTNLAAGWIGAILIFPNFSDLASLSDKLVLILDILAVTVCLLVAFWLEEKGET